MGFSCKKQIEINKVQNALIQSFKIVRKFDWLLDSYVLDFYVDDHWSKLPKSWRTHFEYLNPEEFFQLLDKNIQSFSTAWPLSILALRELLKNICISRAVQFKLTPTHSPIVQHPKLGKFLNKCVKLKKRHEIQRMAAICLTSIERTSVDFAIDFGAGIGHLARTLGYGYGIQICCLEMQSSLNQKAKNIDIQFEKIAKIYLSAEEISKFRRPLHITIQLKATTTATEFIEKVCESLEVATNEFTFGIIGLHTCGDLGAILIRIFLSCKQAKFLNIAGCCYMKLTTFTKTMANQNQLGYPISEFLRNYSYISSDLSFESREIACHASEMFSERLSEGDYENLKVHSYRAAAESILVNYNPALKHIGLRSVKHMVGMTFLEYFTKAVKGLKHHVVDISQDKILSHKIEEDLQKWKRIVIYYTLRLLLAPLVESIVLYDRLLFLLENDCSVEINAIFDPKISPRNHIISAIKHS